MNTDLSMTVLKFLGAGFILAIVAIAALSFTNQPVPPILSDAVSYILIGMLGILSPQPGTQPVTVVNSPTEPV